MTDLKEVIPQPGMLEIQGENLVVSPIKMRQLPGLLQSARNIWHYFDEKDGSLDVLEMFATGHEDIVRLIAVVMDRPEEWVEALDFSDSVQLVRKIIEVNTDFFVMAVLQQQEAKRLAESESPSPGSTSSSS